MTTAALKSLSQAPGLGRLWMFLERNKAAGLVKASKELSANDKVFTVWLGPMQMAVAAHPDTAREVISNPTVFIKGGFKPNPYNPQNKLRQVPELVMSNGQEWQSQRSLLNPAFTSQALKQIIPAFSREADTFLAKIRKLEKDGKELSVPEAMSAFALDVLGNAVLGKSFQAQSGGFDDTYKAYKIVMADGLDPVSLVFPSIYRLPLKRNRELRQAVDTIYSLLASAVDTRRAERAAAKERGEAPRPPADILDMILPHDPSQPGLKEEQLVPNLWTFFIAGHDTTATALAWLMDVFIKHPHVQDKLREEVRRVFGSDPTAVPTDEQLSQLEYMDAVLKESLRLSAPVHNLMTRVAAVDTQLGEYAIPKGTPLSISIYAVNRHADWENPEEFMPERFLEGRKHRTYAWMPFSVGPRRCLGDRFSLMEQKTLLAKLLAGHEILPSKRGKVVVGLQEKIMPLLFYQPESFSVQTRSL